MSRYIFNLVSKSKISIFVFVIYIVFALMSSCLSFVQPYLTGLFIDVLISTKKTAEIISFSVLVALLGIISAVINYLVGTFAIKLCGKYSFELLYTVTDNYLEGSYLVQKKDDPMYVTQKLYTDCNTVCSYFFNNVTIVPVLVLVIAAVMSILLSLNSIIFLLAVFLSLIYITVIFSYKKLIFRTQLEKKEYESKFV
ncbi:ABC transporter transmembrane domain-containing protein, partial [Fannyhessea vaginae]|uniref:ABC transporter transmembrane domain-containing protein n=1 Tax=Fannyhessea vaginae TaxID=82135 RepID=UPI003A7F7ECA